ncbi:flagellar protein G [Natronomonas marina]|uniref:flagellar protein G n=1 Tax=Natronomonas marina TaxID=2961939 RepID=UPI0020C9D2DC|nr:flagellar protein G [Natronomonas marina]
MASVSASTLIIFIAAVGLAAAVSGTMIDSVGTISDSVSERGEVVSDQIDTDVEIISDAGSDAVYDDGTVTVLVKNVGSGTLPSRPDALDVLVDGQYVATADRSITVLGGDAWDEGSVARLVLDWSLGAGTHRVSVHINGETETFEFHV